MCNELVHLGEVKPKYKVDYRLLKLIFHLWHSRTMPGKSGLAELRLNDAPRRMPLFLSNKRIATARYVGRALTSRRQEWRLRCKFGTASQMILYELDLLTCGVAGTCVAL